MAADRQRNFTTMIGERIRVARKDAGLTQGQLSEKLGFKDRQILSNIEGGSRRVTSEEMVNLMRLLGKDLNFFTDSLRLVGEGDFSWRANAQPEMLDAYEEKAKTWIATYRALGKDLDEQFSPLVQQLGLSIASSYEEAWAAADNLRTAWSLGDVPATSLIEVVQKNLSVLVLHVEAPVGISGAACHLPEFDTILVNRREPAGRRMYDFTHELFHVLTWRTMPPEPLDVEKPAGNKAKKIEQLANHFAGALLMPAVAVGKLWGGRGSREVNDYLTAQADHFGVTARALFVRLQVLGLPSAQELQDISESRLRWNGRAPGEPELPLLFSRPFVSRIANGIEHGWISVRRAASLLDLGLAALADLMRTYDVAVPETLEGLVAEVPAPLPAKGRVAKARTASAKRGGR